MKLLKASEIPHLQDELVFRHSKWIALILPLFIGGIAGGIAFAAYHVSSVILGIFAALMWLLFYVMLGSIGSAWSERNWLLRISPNQIVIQFRSYLNRHFPDTDPIAVALSKDEILSVGCARESISVPGAEVNERWVQNYSFLDLRLEPAIVSEIAQALKNERDRLAPKIGVSRMKYIHNPVFLVEPDLLRLTWRGRSDLIFPSIKKALELLKSQKIPLHNEPAPVFTQSNTESELRTKLLFLCESGDKIAAIKIARKHLGMDLAEAKKYVENLRSS